MATKRLHTPTPWYLGEMEVDPGEGGWDGTIRSAADAYEIGEDYEIADVVDLADAEYIVRAVNSHADLLDACEAALGFLADRMLHAHATAGVLREAIAKAKGEQP